MATTEPEKPDFLQCCLVCNRALSAADQPAVRSLDGVECRQLVASHICPAARDELSTVELLCDQCLALVEQWNSARHTLRKLHASVSSTYRASRQQRAGRVLRLTVDRMVVRMPYSVFLMNVRTGPRRPWADTVHHVTAAVLESAGIARKTGADASSPAPSHCKTVACQTQATPERRPVRGRPSRRSVAVGVGADSGGARSAPIAHQIAPLGPRPRTSERRPDLSGRQSELSGCRLDLSDRKSDSQDVQSELQEQRGPPSDRPARPLPVRAAAASLPDGDGRTPRPAELGCLRGWEGITNVQPSAPTRPAGTHKRVGFEGLKEQAARARDLEETLSILSVADTASLLDRTETLSVFSDTAELGGLADDHPTSLEPADDRQPDDIAGRATRTGHHDVAPAVLPPSVSFVEPAAGGAQVPRRSTDGGEDLLREFAETMSNISEGVVLEDLEGYFEEIDRPWHGAGKVVASAWSGRAAPAAAVRSPDPTASASGGDPRATRCPVCHKQFRHARYLRPHLRLHDGTLLQCHLCAARFLHHYKLQLHLRRRHSLPPQADRPASRPPPPPPPPPPAAERRHQAGQLRCADCGRTFSRLTTLRQHEQVHRGGGYWCTSCRRVFPSKSDLQRHADSHRPEKLYKCADCGKAFQVSTSLARHRTLHTNRAAGCDVCGRLFDRKDTMLKHRDTHKTSNEHRCGLCGKQFKQRRILAKHVKLLHGGPAAFTCAVCQKPFRTRYDMVAHACRVHSADTAVAGGESDAAAENDVERVGLKKERDSTPALVDRAVVKERDGTPA